MIKIDKFPHTPVGDKRAKKWHYLNEAKKMNKYIKDGDVVYDCGANIFDHTIFFALNGVNVSVFAFEPVKEYFDLGIKNIDYFGAKNITPLNIALGEQKGELKISLDNEGSSMIFDHKNSKYEIIKVDTIDSLVKNGLIKPPSLIKVDVEGFAHPLLVGAENTIRKYMPTIIIEIHPQFVGVKDAKEKIFFLQKMGYKVVSIFDGDREFVLKKEGTPIFWEEKFEKSFIKHNLSSVVWNFREAYEVAKGKNKRKEIIVKYRDFASKNRIPLFKKMIWSKLYCIFTLKFFSRGQ